MTAAAAEEGTRESAPLLNAREKAAGTTPTASQQIKSTRTTVLAVAACCLAGFTLLYYASGRGSDVFASTREEVTLSTHAQKDVESIKELEAVDLWKRFVGELPDDQHQSLQLLMHTVQALPEEEVNNFVAQAKLVESSDATEKDVEDFVDNFQHKVPDFKDFEHVLDLVDTWGKHELPKAGEAPKDQQAQRFALFTQRMFPLMYKFPAWDYSDTNQLRIIVRRLQNNDKNKKHKAKTSEKLPSLGSVSEEFSMLNGVREPRRTASLPMSEFATNVRTGAMAALGQAQAQLGSQNPLEANFDPESIGLPRHFDARQACPKCASVIGTVRDQGKCGSCWAVSAVEVMNDRLCISSQGASQQELSPQFPLSCFSSGNGCDGGDTADTLEEAFSRGIPTGGMLSGPKACLPYEFQPCDHPCQVAGTMPEACPQTCADGSAMEYTFPKSQAYSCPLEDWACMAKELHAYGSIAVTFGQVYPDFYSHKTGVYKVPDTANKPLGLHATKLIGWGFTDSGEPYWMMMNSWRNWGDNGLGFIGIGQMNIENQVSAIKM